MLEAIVAAGRQPVAVTGQLRPLRLQPSNQEGGQQVARLPAILFGSTA